MGLILKQNKLIIQKGTNIDNNNKNKVDLLNKNKLYSTDSMNFFGRHLAYYLCNSSHLELSNSEPINLLKNTFAKVLMRIKVFDSFLKLPLEKYTSKKFNEFMSAFREGKIKTSANKTLKPDSLNNYVSEFKRIHTIYKAWILKYKPNQYDPRKIEWVNNLKSPRLDRRRYEKYPYLEMAQIRKFAKNLNNEEYELRTLLSVNLMARKIEMTDLKYKHIEFRPDDKIWVQLPDVKKHSSEKVPVQVYDFILPMLKNYLDKKKKWRNNDLIFPSRDFAFSRHIMRKSEELLKERINAKTLRKLGVCVAEQLGYSRSDVERIGGWAVNTTVLNHYFNRKGVALSKKQNSKLNEAVHPDLTDKYNEIASQNRILSTKLRKQEKELKKLDKMSKIEKRLENLEELTDYGITKKQIDKFDMPDKNANKEAKRKQMLRLLKEHEEDEK